MRLAQAPNTPGQDARVSRGLNADELRAQLSAAVERFDHHMTEAQDLGHMNRTVDALEHLGLANKAAREAESLADQITALGRTTDTRNPRSSWVTSK